MGADAESLGDAASGASATLSQLAAKILNQLSLSAWLPSAALVLIIAFILELGANLKAPPRPPLPATAHAKIASWTVNDVLTRSFSTVGHAGFGPITLLVLIIVVATMITQAFSFEAIRLLEGYWGPNARVDKFADWCCNRHQGRQATLNARYKALTLDAWAQVESAIRHTRPRFSAAMVGKLKEQIVGTYARGSLSEEDQERVESYDWQASVDARILRQRYSVGERLREYPRDASRVMATRLGNVMRRHERETGADDVEGFVERVYHTLPFSMQLSHDEQRARIDLYCSMVFVLWLSAVAAFARFGWWAWPFTLGFAGIAIVGSFVAYRAAIASARYYGLLIVGIANWVAAQSSTVDEQAA